MLVEGLKASNHAVAVPSEHGRLNTAKNLDEIFGQFEWSSFESETFTRGIGQHEPEINVNQVTLFIQEHVGIMSILDLQDVAY